MRRFLLVDARLGGLAGLFVAGGSVRGGGPFRDRSPGRADAGVGYFTLKGSLTYVTARRAGRTAMVFLNLESKSRQDCGHDVLELSRSVQT